MPQIKIITSAKTQKAGEQLAHAIQERYGQTVSVTPPTPPADTRLYRILDTLAVMRETETTLKAQVEQVIAQHPEWVQGSESLSVEDRITNTTANRAAIHATLGDGRPMYPPEEFILAGAAVAMGGEAQHLGSLIYLKSQHQQTTEAQFREALNHPEQSTIALGEQIQRRIDNPTVRNIPAPEPDGISWDPSKMEFAPVDPEELDQYRADAYEDQRGGYEPGED